MKTRDVLGFVLVPLVLLVAAWMINTFQLWDFLANMTLPWFCTAVAVSVLLLGAVCVVLEVSPTAVPGRVAVMVVVGTMAIFGAGMVVDFLFYVRPDDWAASVGGWIGFGAVLGGVFTLPQLRPRSAQDTAQREFDSHG